MNHSAFSRMAHQLTSLKKPNFLYCLRIAKTVNGLTILIPFTGARSELKRGLDLKCGYFHRFDEMKFNSNYTWKMEFVI